MNRFSLSRLLPVLALLGLLAPSANAWDVPRAKAMPQTVSQKQPDAHSPRGATAPNGLAAHANSNGTLAVKHTTGGDGAQFVSAPTAPSYGREFIVGAASTLAGFVGGAIGTCFGAPVLGASIGAGFGGALAAWLYDYFSR